MTKKEFGKKVWEGTKDVASVGVGLGTGIVVGTVCMKFAPTEAAKAIEIGYKVGTYGFSTVMGTVAADLTKQEIDEIEEKTKSKLKILRNRKDKVIVEVVE